MSTPQDNLIRRLKAMLKWGNGPCGGGGTVDDHSNGRREAEYRMKVELRRLLKEFESANARSAAARDNNQPHETDGHSTK